MRMLEATGDACTREITVVRAERCPERCYLTPNAPMQTGVKMSRIKRNSRDVQPLIGCCVGAVLGTRIDAFPRLACGTIKSSSVIFSLPIATLEL